MQNISGGNGYENLMDHQKGDNTSDVKSQMDEKALKKNVKSIHDLLRKTLDKSYELYNEKPIKEGHDLIIELESAWRVVNKMM